MKYFFLIPLLLLVLVSHAQTPGSEKIIGTIIVPEGYQPEGIHIYNKSSGAGAVSDLNGSFELKVVVGDTLHFSAVQFQALEVVIFPETLEQGILKVEIYEGLNQLPEIVVLPHDLTGNLEEDSEKIEVVEIPAFPPIKIIPKSADERFVKNSALNEIGGGANHFALLMKGIRLLFPKRRDKKEVAKTAWTPMEQVVLERALRDRFDDQFFFDNFGIPVAEISAFAGFVAQGGFRESLLGSNREMELIQFLMEKSEEYRQQD